jgi:hypothetical protein
MLAFFSPPIVVSAGNPLYLVAVPEVPQGVVLARPLKIHEDEVVGELGASRGRRRSATHEVATVHDVEPLRGGPGTGVARVAVGMSARDLEREGLARPDLGSASERLNLVQVVQRTDLVVGTPLTPVRR